MNSLILKCSSPDYNGDIIILLHMFQNKLLKNKNLYSLIGYQLINSLADRFFLFCLPWFVYDITQSATQMTFTFGMSMAPHLFFSLFGGAVVDYISRRKIILTASLLSSITLAGFSISIFILDVGDHVHIIYALSFLLALYNSIDAAAFEAMLPECFEKKDLVYLNTISEFVYYFSNIIGPLIAGAVIIMIGSKLSLFVTSILYFISFIFILLSKARKESFVPKKFEELGHLLCEHFDLTKESLIYIFRPECPIQLGLLMSVLSNLLLGAQETLIMFIARSSFSVDAELFALCISFTSIITLVVLLFTIKWLNKYHIFSIMIFSIIIDALANISIGLSSNMILLFVFYCGSTIATAIYSVFWKTFRQSYIPPEMLGRVISVCRSLAYGFSGLGALVGSALINYINPRSILILGGTLVTLFGILAFYLKKLYPAGTFRKNI